MGDPRKHRRKYSTPSHPWERARLEQEKEITKNYGMKNKKEIWKIASLLQHFKKEVKRLAGKQDPQSQIETNQLRERLAKLGIASKDIDLNQVLDLTIDSVLSRRLQAVVYKKGLARTPKQARQFITHGHILISNQKVTTPSYLVNIDEELKITFSHRSTLHSSEHPERIKKKEELPKKPKKETKQEPEKKPETKQQPKEKVETKETPKEEVKEDAKNTS